MLCLFLNSEDLMMDIPEYLSSGEVTRLIPVTADSNKEARAVSILLATLLSVPAFQRKMLASLGIRAGVKSKIECFTEIVFKNDESPSKSRPDGLLILESGRGRSWSCLIEAKIKNEDLVLDQVERYIGLAKQFNIDAVLTISNQFVAMPEHTPLALTKSSIRGIQIYHWSWMYALTIAMLLLYEDKFDSPEQKYILSEMVRYFSHPSIGVSSFDSMNSEWKDIVTKIQSGSVLNKSDLDVEKTVGAWHQEARDISLLLSRKLNCLVELKLSRSHIENPTGRIKDDCEHLVKNNKLECILVIPDAASPMIVTADLLRRSISISMKIEAPTNKQKTSSRVNWLLKQLSKTTNSENLYIRAIWPGRCEDTQALFSKVRENPSILQQTNTNNSPCEFEIILIRDLAGKFSGPKTFNEQLDLAVIEFYEHAGQHLRVYIPNPPPIVEEGIETDTTVVNKLSEKCQSASTQATNEIQQVNSSDGLDKTGQS